MWLLALICAPFQDVGSRGPLGVILGRLGKMDSKWRKWWTRGVFTFIMIGVFGVIIYMGPLALSLLVLLILIKCFQEIISIGYNKYKEYNLPLYRVLNWYGITNVVRSSAIRIPSALQVFPVGGYLFSVWG